MQRTHPRSEPAEAPIVDGATSGAAAEPHADHNDFLIAQGGPFMAAHERAGLTKGTMLRPVLRVPIYVAVAYVPLLILCLIAGTAVEPSGGRGLLNGFQPYASYLVALPLLILMEPMANQRLRSLLDHFLRAEIVPARQVPDFRRHVRRAVELRNSWLAEAIIAVAVYTLSYLLIDETLARYGESWLGASDAGSHARLSWAGWWAVLVSGPLVGFLILRWLWRYLIWANLIRQIAGLDLRVVTSHPDKTGGLAFISQYPTVFSAFVFAITTIIAAMIARDLVYSGTPVASLKYVIIAWILAMVVIYTIPLTAFSFPLSTVKRQEILHASALASRAPTPDEPEAATPAGTGVGAHAAGHDVPAEAKKRYDAARSMSTFPLGASAILPISLAAALPIAVAAATQLPIKQILTFLKFLII